LETNFQSRLFLDSFFQLLSRFKDRNFTGWDFEGFAGFGIDAVTGFAMGYAK